jgi:hypothetical protein
MCPRHRSKPKRPRVRRRAVSRWTSRSRSIASCPMPPGALRSAARRSDRLEIVCSRLSAMAAKCCSSRAIRVGSALGRRWSGRSNALVVRWFTFRDSRSAGSGLGRRFCGTTGALRQDPRRAIRWEWKGVGTPFLCCLEALLSTFQRGQIAHCESPMLAMLVHDHLKTLSHRV